MSRTMQVVSVEIDVACVCKKSETFTVLMDDGNRVHGVCPNCDRAVSGHFYMQWSNNSAEKEVQIRIINNETQT